MNRVPLILLPGTLCDVTLFEHQVANLGDVCEPVVIDVSQQDTLGGVAQFILEQVDGQFAVAGLSYGGIVAFELWRQAPERILKMALLNTNPYAVNEEKRAIQQRFVGMAHLGNFREVTTDFLKDVMLHPDHQKDMVLRQKVLAMAESIGINGFVNEVKAQLARPDSTSDLPTITCPTLVLTGQEDVFCPVHVHEAMAAAIPNSHLVIVEHCGHLSTMEQPEFVTNALRDWMCTETGLNKHEIDNRK